MHCDDVAGVGSDLDLTECGDQPGAQIGVDTDRSESGVQSFGPHPGGVDGTSRKGDDDLERRSEQRCGIIGQALLDRLDQGAESREFATDDRRMVAEGLADQVECGSRGDSPARRTAAAHTAEVDRGWIAGEHGNDAADQPRRRGDRVDVLGDRHVAEVDLFDHRAQHLDDGRHQRFGIIDAGNGDIDGRAHVAEHRGDRTVADQRGDRIEFEDRRDLDLAVDDAREVECLEVVEQGHGANSMTAFEIETVQNWSVSTDHELVPANATPIDTVSVPVSAIPCPPTTTRSPSGFTVTAMRSKGSGSAIHPNAPSAMR